MKHNLIFSLIIPILLMTSSFSAYGFEEPVSLIEGGEIKGYALGNVPDDWYSHSLVIKIKTFQDGEVMVKLERDTIDAKFGNDDDRFYVAVGDKNLLIEKSFEEESTSTHRTLTIPFEAGDDEIWIFGTEIDEKGFDKYLEQKESECKKSVDADGSLMYGEKIVAKRDCDSQTLTAAEIVSLEAQGLQTREVEGQDWVDDCEEWIELYELLGKKNLYEYYGEGNFLRSCVKIYEEGLWYYQGEDKFKKIAKLLEGGELAEMEAAGFSGLEKKIPDWIRNNAQWWAEGAIGDSDFVSGIQYLIKEEIIKIPNVIYTTAIDESNEIPSWIKNNADWWSQGLISDDDFLKGIQYLIQQGIIKV